MVKLQKAEKVVARWLATNPAKPVVVIVGPTASGKTDLALQIAENLALATCPPKRSEGRKAGVEGEIVNADSRQIYKGLTIGSAPPSATELEKIPHHLIAKFSPRTTISVAKYRKLAEKKIREIAKRGKLPILTGGHTLLISAIVENFRFPGKSNESRRAELDKIWKKNPQKLWKILEKIDPVLAKKIPAENRHHLIRAIERVEKTEKPSQGKRKFDFLILGIEIDREKLYARINRRVDEMLEKGLLAEVETLAAKYDRNSPALRGHGYREILDFLNGEKDFETAVEEIKRNTRNYAKRQMTWWRNCRFAEEIFWIKLAK